MNRKNLSIKEIRSKVLSLLIGLKPYRIILFGSYAWGEPHEDSDLDLLVVTSDEFVPQNWEEGIKIYLNYARALRPLATEMKIPYDLKVLTKAEFELAKRMGMSFFNQIIEEGILLYDAEGESQRVAQSSL